MRILIADKMTKRAVEELKTLPADVEVRPGLNAEELKTALAGVQVLVVRSTKVTAQTLAAAPDLSLIVRAGTGVDTIDIAAATAGGIWVANCPGMNADAVAEMTMGLLIAADRQIVPGTEALRGGAWKKAALGQARGLKNSTLGLIGFGIIGQAVARKARAMEMRVLAYSRSLTRDQAAALGVEFCGSLEEIAHRADAVSIHVALNGETRGLIGKEFLAAMKQGSVLVNTARGEVVDIAALKSAIREKGLRVGLDVFANEPAGGDGLFEDTEMASLATCTPHLGASTDQASEAITDEVVRVIRAFVKTGYPLNPVNDAGRYNGPVPRG